MYDLVKKIRTDIDLDLIQKSCCFSFQDCIDGIVALGWQSLTNLETYPEDGRLILDYGMEYDEVVDVLTNKNIVFED